MADNDQPNDTSPTADGPAEMPGRVECPAARDPIVRYLIVAGMLLAFAIWCIVEVLLGKYPYVAPHEDINEFLGYALNHYAPWVLIPAAVAFVAYAIRTKKRCLVADDEGVGYAGGGKVAWDDMETVDATRLGSKGILIVHHPGGTLKLDSWKLRNFRELASFMEEKLPAEKIQR